jgi:hypothetical protein
LSIDKSDKYPLKTHALKWEILNLKLNNHRKYYYVE